jgi:hypothetical protein
VELLDVPECPLEKKMLECFDIIDNIRNRNQRVLVHW